MPDKYLPDISVYERFLKDSNLAPRVTSLRNHFENITDGTSQVPSKPISYHKELIFNDSHILKCCKYLINNISIFCKHYYASIPYVLEEDARIASAIIKYFNIVKSTTNHFCFYEPSGGSIPIFAQIA